MSKKYNYFKNADGLFECGHCGKVYKHDRGARGHIKAVHGENKSEPKVTIEKIQAKDATREEKLSEMYEAVRDFNKSLKTLENSKKNITFDVVGGFIVVVGISDLHYGNVNVNMDYVDKLLEFVEKEERAYCFLNGDILDNWVEISPKGGVYEQTVPPEYQKEIMVNKLKPIKHKILAIVDGNHEGRSSKAGERSPSEDMAEALDVPYLGQGGRVNLNFGKFTYKMHIRHRFRYESSFNPCNANGRLVEQLDSEADIVAIGHKHDPAIEVRYKAGKQRSFMRFGSAMPSTNFSDSLGFDESPPVAPCVILSGKEFMHHPVIDIGVAKSYIRSVDK